MSEVDDLIAGRYRLRAMLGRGAMGVVWQAVDQRLHRTVALKQLSQLNVDPQHAEQARQRAMREGRIAARLHHPNAVAVHDVEIDNGLPVLIMEYLPSRSLADIIAEYGRLSPDDVAHVGAQVASALSAAHAAGIVHRDVKPANILITDDGTAKLTDFGISHAAGDVALTQTGMFAGTPAYLAPEIALGHRPTPASDIYSFGSTLYAALEGSPPFGDDAANPLALLHVIAAGQVRQPHHAAGLTPVLAAMLNADPAQRLDAGQVTDALRASTTGAPLPPFVEAAAAPWATPESATMPAPGANGPAGTLLDAHPMQHPGPPVQQQVGTNYRARYLAAGVAVAALAVIVLLVSLLSAESPPVAQPAPESETSTPTQTLQPADFKRAALEYYRLLPGQAEQAWQRLAPAMRSSDRGEYLARWQSIRQVVVFSQPRNTGSNNVHIGVELHQSNGSRVREFRQLEFTTDTPRPLITSVALLHRERIPAPEPPEDDKDDKSKEKEKPEGWEAHKGKGDGKEKGEDD
ncbi:serine/threonine-protein kinase [Haloechinothrix halophila]|uniref:serine/threonine-protein kinase n=1 Tax=Haloechinothrix halophila TaxID=1069073 RepID=UPI0003F6497D|nr:serine/threonine-protein kinase [Haloechinothrix halophila]